MCIRQLVHLYVQAPQLYGACMLAHTSAHTSAQWPHSVTLLHSWNGVFHGAWCRVIHLVCTMQWTVCFCTVAFPALHQLHNSMLTRLCYIFTLHACAHSEDMPGMRVGRGLSLTIWLGAEHENSSVSSVASCMQTAGRDSSVIVQCEHCWRWTLKNHGTAGPRPESMRGQCRIAKSRCCIL